MLEHKEEGGGKKAARLLAEFFYWIISCASKRRVKEIQQIRAGLTKFCLWACAPSFPSTQLLTWNTSSLRIPLRQLIVLAGSLLSRA